MHHPWQAIAIVLLVTVVLGYFTAGVSFSSNEEDFFPTSEVAAASTRADSFFGAQGQSVTIVCTDDENILSRASLTAQLLLEQSILESGATGIIASSFQSPWGIQSIATLIAQSRFIDEAFSQLSPQAYAAGIGGDILRERLFATMIALSPTDMIAVLDGGTYNVIIGDKEYAILFEPYDPSMVAQLVSASSVPDAFSFLLSNDADLESGIASRSIMNIALADGLAADELLTGEQAIAALADAAEAPGRTYAVLGDALVEQAINDASGANIGMIMSLALVMVLVVLILIYQSIKDTIITLLALLMAITWVFGIGQILDFSFNPAITTVPVLIIGLGIDYGIHYNMRYREEIRKGKKVREALIEAGSTVGFAILLATVTTLVGFLSNATSSVPSIRQFGILCAIGIMSSFVVMVTFFPAVKALYDGRRERRGLPVVREKKDRTRGWGMSRIIQRAPTEKDPVCASGPSCTNTFVGLGAVASRRPLIVLALLVVVAIAAAHQGLNLEARYDFRDFLPSGIEETRTTNLLFDEFSFSSESISIYVAGDITDPAVLLAAAEAERLSLQSPYAVLSEQAYTPLSLARSLASPLSPQYAEGFAAWWNEFVDTDGDGLPDNGVGQDTVRELYDRILAASPESARRVIHSVDGHYDAMLLRIPVNSGSGIRAREVTADITRASQPLESLKGGALSAVVVTGGPAIQNEILSSINDSQISSVLLTFVVALAILTALYFVIRKSLMLGAITLLPLVFVIIWTAGSMYVLGIPLNVVTVTIAAITVGLGIDYGIHVTQRFIEDIETYPNVDCALCVAVHHTGSALFGSALTTILGFGLLSLSIIPPLSQFGKVTALSIAFAFLAAVFVLPTFIRLWYMHGKQESAKR